MRLDRAAFVTFLLTAGYSGQGGSFQVEALLSSSPKRTSFVPLSYSSSVENAPPSPVPTSLGLKKTSSPSERKKQRSRGRRKTPKWEGQEIPEDIPQLSEIMKSVSMDDFAGQPDRALSKTEIHANGERTDERLDRTVSKTERRTNGNRTGKRMSPSKSTPPEQGVGSPWEATYQVSTQTQERIKTAANSNQRRRPVESATAILKALLETPPERCNEVNVVCALTLSAKTMNPSSPVTEEFRSLLLRTLDILQQLVVRQRLNARQLCNAVWAIAKHYNLDHSILPAPPETTALPSHEMAGVAEAWILQDAIDDSAEQRVKDTVDIIATQITKILQTQDETGRSIKVGEISMASWAYGVLRPRQRPPGWAIPPQIGQVRRKPRRPDKTRDVEIVTFTQWAQDDESDYNLPADVIDRLFDAMGDTLSRQEMDEHGFPTGPVLLESCSWSEMANIAWAYAHHGYSKTIPAERLLQGLSEEAIRRLNTIKEDRLLPNSGTSHQMMKVLPRDVAQLVWSIGVLQSDNFRLGDDLVHLVNAVATYYGIPDDDNSVVVSSPLKHWSCPDLVQLAISLAHGRIDHLPLLRALFDEASTRLLETQDYSFVRQDKRAGFLAWEVSVLMWAQARLYLRQPEGAVFDSFASEATRWLANSMEGGLSLEGIGIGPQEQANLAWSLTVLEKYQLPEAAILLGRIFQEASSSSEQRHSIQLEHAHQLWQALYLLEDTCPSAVDRVPTWFRDFLENKWNAEKARRKKSSARHRSLSQTLALMGVAHYNEHDEDIDVAIVLKENSVWTHTASHSDHNGARVKVAVEFDGPNHFTREKWDSGGKRVQPRALGHTVLKYQLLKKQGWVVVRVPYYEFDKIPFWASMERQRYLQRLLKTHESIRFSKVDVSDHQAHVISNRKSRFD